MGIETVSSIISAFVGGSLGIAALLRNWRSKTCVLFAALCGLLLAHDLMAMVEEISGELATPKIHVLLTLAIAPVLLLFLREVISGFDRTLGKLAAAYIPVGVVAVLVLSFQSQPFVDRVLFLGSHAAFLLPAAAWIFLIARAEDQTTFTRERLRLRYLNWGVVFVLAFHITDVIHYSHLEKVPALGTLARTLYLFFVFQTVIQKELMTAEEVATKIALFGGVALVLSTIYTLLVSWVGDQQGLFFFNTFIASFVIIVLFDPIRKFTMRGVRHLFLHRNLVLERELEALSRDLIGVVDPLDLAKKIQRTLERSLGLGQCALFILERDGLSYTRLEGKLGTPELSASNSLVEYMALRRGRPFVWETIENDRDSFYSAQHRRFCESCLETMRALGADFILPFLYEAKAVGFCVVVTGERVALSNEQLRLFLPISRQVALLLKNAQTFHRLRDRDKLAAAGEMAAGLAHEIKNPLGAIKGAAQLLKESSEFGRKSENSDEFLKIIVDETDRLSVVLTDFLDYAKPRKSDHGAVSDPVKVIEHTAQMALRDSKVAFELEVEGSGVQIDMDPELLKQVLLNLFLNAAQAMHGVEHAKLKVRVREIRPRILFNLKESLPLFKVWEGWNVAGEKHDPYVEIEVIDIGPGIPPEEAKHIFVPFYTTKAKGTGLGLPICQRIVESVGGTISVRPHLPTGTVFVLHLPVRSEVPGKILDGMIPRWLPLKEPNA